MWARHVSIFVFALSVTLTEKPWFSLSSKSASTRNKSHSKKTLIEEFSIGTFKSVDIHDRIGENI